MAYALKVKNKGVPVEVKRVAAWKLDGENPSPKLQGLMAEGKILFHPESRQFELFSQEAHTDGGQMAPEGDYFKVDSSGYPYPNSRAFFEANHRYIQGDVWEQLPSKVEYWKPGMPITPAVKFLIDTGFKDFKINEDSEERFFTATLWDAPASAPRTSTLMFYSVTTDGTGAVVDVDFNFIAEKQWNEDYMEI